jgi:hypothetical protein
MNGKGGAGGAIQDVTLIGTRLTVSNFTSGNGGAGGNGGVAGKGGAGGNISGVAIRTTEDLNPPASTSTTTASTGLLIDPNANFGPEGADVFPGELVENTLTNTLTTVTAVVSNTELQLASDIFATGDPYEVLSFESVTGTAAASQYTIIDSTANFLTDGLQVGQVVEDLTDTNLNNGTPVAATISQIVSNTTLLVSTDISHVGDQYYFPTVGGATITAGSGGAGQLTGAGGAGGSIINANAEMPGSVSFTSGTGGGGGATAAAGAGGTLNNVGAFSSLGSGSLQAGSAGPTGEKPGAGGSILGADVQTFIGVSIIAGNGSAGGAGGNITAGGFSGVLNDGAGFNPPSGNVTIQAGTGGSSTTGNGGAGGSVTGLTGFISSGDQVNPYTTQFDGGPGGSGLKVGGAGGSVSNIRFFGGGGPGVTFFINAGDAGNAATGKTGATGGSVDNIGGGAYVSGSTDPNFSISTLTDFHHISAGNGGDAVTTGGLGGSVSNVFVNAAIGVRTGAIFGFDLAGMGGISAGAGGTGGTADGLAGNVTNIAADAIASIVAGHLGKAGQATGSGGVFTGTALLKSNLATKVNNIILNGTTPLSTVQQFELYYDGIATAPINTNATALEVAAALNAVITPIQAADNVPATEQGVSVKVTSTGYVVTYNDDGIQPYMITGNEPAPIYTTELTQGNGTTAEVQKVQTFGIDPFTLTFEGYTTTQLDPNASAADVMAALDALPSIGPGGVTVTYNPGTYNAANPTLSTNPANPANPSYTVSWTTAGQQPLIVPNFVVNVQTTNGTATAPETDTLTLPTRGDLTPSQVATANFVGSIYDVLRPDATTFSFLPAGSSTFQFGDTPIDGLIAAVTIPAAKSAVYEFQKNFVPEAFVSADASGNAVLVDNVNT